GRYKAADGKFRRVPLCADKTASKQLLAKLVTDAKLTQHGMGDAFEEHHKRPLREHLEDFRRYLLAKGNTEKHVQQTYTRALAVLDGCRFVFLADLSASAVAEFLHDLRRDPPASALPAGQESFTLAEMVKALGCNPQSVPMMLRRHGLDAKGSGKARRYPRATVEALAERLCRGKATTTSKGYLTAIKGFSRWLVKARRAPADPLAPLSRLNADTDVRRERRALAESELRALLTAAGSSDTAFRELSG